MVFNGLKFKIIIFFIKLENLVVFDVISYIVGCVYRLRFIDDNYFLYVF